MAGGSDKNSRRGDRPGQRRSSGGPKGSRRSGGRNQRDSQSRDGQRRDAQGRRDTRGRDERGERIDGERPPRPPIKGRRRTFDVDSAPNEKERRRLADPESVPSELDADWVDEGPVRRAAGDAVRRSRQTKPNAKQATSKNTTSKNTTSKNTSSKGRNDKRRAQRAAKRAEGALDIDKAKLASQIGAARASRTIERLGEASDAFGQERFEDARRTLKPLVDLVPNEPVLRELYGLTLYRLGKWKQAIVELEEFTRRTGSTEQHPVLADCYRALRDHDRVAALWEELGEASPDAATVAEGRIVYAGSLADQGDVPGAIGVLEAGALGRGKLRFHHLRMRYALADLYDRAGEQQSARRHFATVAEADPNFFDVTDRLRQL